MGILLTLNKIDITMSKTIIVSNRLPVSLQHKFGKFEFKPSAGGLATGLGSIYKEGDNIWIGWPGNDVDNPDQREEVIEELKNLKMAPVFLTKEDIELY
jgi:trehalose 6-phosphate synthase/phosphatase